MTHARYLRPLTYSTDTKPLWWQFPAGIVGIVGGLAVRHCLIPFIPEKILRCLLIATLLVRRLQASGKYPICKKEIYACQYTQCRQVQAPLGHRMVP